MTLSCSGTNCPYIRDETHYTGHKLGLASYTCPTLPLVHETGKLRPAKRQIYRLVSCVR